MNNMAHECGFKSIDLKFLHSHLCALNLCYLQLVQLFSNALLQTIYSDFLDFKVNTYNKIRQA